MKARNVIISLFLVLALLVFIFIRVRYFEPKKGLSFNRNPSRIEYTRLALCLMDCYHINANDITEMIRTGSLNNGKSNMKQKPFPVFTVDGVTKRKTKLSILIEQAGKVAKIKSCHRQDETFVCNCPGELDNPVSYLNSYH